MKKGRSIALLTVMIITILFVQCKTANNPANIPACITNIIEQIKKDSVRNPPASVWRYEYNGKTVYYIPPYCCDMYGQLFDSECNLLCYPDGGITGHGDGKCPDFFSKRTNEKLIWKDPR